MKTILRNLFYTLKRFQTASVLNLMGLSAAFAAFVLLMMKVSYERDFDTCYPYTDRLVMLNLAQPQEENYVSTLPRGPIDYLIQQVPGIEYGTIYSPAWQKQAFYTDPKNPQYFYEEPWAVYPDFGKIIGLKFVEGSDQEMKQPESVIVSESYARKLFPNGNALGSSCTQILQTGEIRKLPNSEYAVFLKTYRKTASSKMTSLFRWENFRRTTGAARTFLHSSC